MIKIPMYKKPSVLLALNSIGQWDCNFQATPPNYIKLKLANHNLKTEPSFLAQYAVTGPVVRLLV